jgi:hypothetical protein
LTAIAPPLETSCTLAERQAADNWSANAAALRSTQNTILEALRSTPQEFSFLFGRDGSLTAMSADGKWWNGCSLPRRAAASILKTLNSTGRVSCFLSPPHAAQIRFALDRVQPNQAIIVLCPDAAALAVMLRCENFFADISAHRLLFAWGSDWKEEMTRVFEEHPGLPTPEQFIRGAAVDHGDTDALIRVAQEVFAATTARRSARINSSRQSWSPSHRAAPRICLVAPSHFHLWEDGGNVLAEVLAHASEEECEIVRFDNDDPTSAAPLALAETAQHCDAIVSLNLARADLPEILPRQMPWITWVVREPIPAAKAAGPRDALLVADSRWRSDALGSGWSKERVEVAFWPAIQTAPAGPTENYLTLAADTLPLEAPPQVVDLSSQHLLWDAIAAEIAEDPFVVTPDAEKYLRRRQRDIRIPDEGFNRDLFVNLLITPAFQQSIARLLLKEKLPVRVIGRGWQRIEEFAGAAAGPVRTRLELADVIQSASALVYAWPTPRAHPIDALARPVLRPAIGRPQFLSAAQSAIQGQVRANPCAQRVLNHGVILELLAKLRTSG